MRITKREQDEDKKLQKLKESEKIAQETALVTKVMRAYRDLPIHNSSKLDVAAVNWAMYNGKQHFVKGRSYESYDSPATRGIKHQSKVNIITGNTDISVSKILKEQPVARALPAGTSPEDKRAADVGSALLNNVFNSNNIDLTGKQYEVLTIAKVMDTGFLKVMWDPKADAGLGYFDIQTHDIFEVFPDPAARDYFSMRFCFHRYLKDKSAVEAMYPHLSKLAEYTETGSTTKYKYMSEKEVRDFSGHVLVTEYWERPNSVYPKGRKLIIINDTILASNKDNPFHRYGVYSMPFVPFYWKKAHDDIYGINTFSDEVNLQREVNALSTLIIENARRMALIKWFVPKGSNIKDRDIDDAVGQILEYNAGQGAVVQGTPASLPSYVPNHLSFLIGASQDVSGHHEVSMGQLPERGSQISGTALKLLMDSEQVRHSPAMRRLKSSLKIVAKLVLLLAQDLISEPRMISIVGTNQDYAIKKYSGADLKGSIDVLVSIGSAFTNSPAQKVETLFNLWDRGIISAAVGGDKGAQMLMSSLEYGDIDVTRMDEMQKNRAYKVLDMIVEKKTVPPISSVDDHDVHIKVLNEYRLTDKFESLDAAVKQAILSRIDMHKELQTSETVQDKINKGKYVSPQEAQAPNPAAGQNAGMAMTAGGEG